MVLLAKALREQVMERDAQLASCQRHVFVVVATSLVLRIRSKAIKRYMSKMSRSSQWHNSLLRRTIFFESSTVTTLALLLLTEGRIGQLDSELFGR